MRRLPIVFIVALMGCSSASDSPEPPPESPRRLQRRAIPDLPSMLLGIVPDDAWWRDPGLAAALKLTDDQFRALDKIAEEQGDQIDRLERDLRVAMRDFRNALLADPLTSADINNAAQRVRALRDAIFDRQAQMLAAERLVLTRSQWADLLGELQRRRDELGRWDERVPGGRPRIYPRGGRGRPWPY